MTVEISVEIYLFTCARCTTRWTENYEVSQVTDDAGEVRSFYRHAGAPCEAPVSGNVNCPSCRATTVFRNPVYGAEPGFDPEQAGGVLAAQAGPSEVHIPVQHSGAHSWRRFKFAAVVTLEAMGRPHWQYLSGTPGLVIRAPSCDRPTQRHYFPAVLYTDDDRPLRPGDRGVLVTVSVPDDDASSYFRSGQHFALWDGSEVGHGTVAQRLFYQAR